VRGNWSGPAALLFAGTLASVAEAAFPGVMATSYGADPSGEADSAAAINACLSAAGHGGVCFATGGKFKLAQDVVIPANTTLACGSGYPGRDNYNAGYATMPALMLDRAHSIIAGGDGAKLTGCLTYRLGMVFPPPDSTDFAGVAVDDRGRANFTVTDSEIIGFDTCLWIRGLRPYINRGLADCSGVAKAAIEWDTGNTDSGYFRDWRVNPLNGSGTCESLTRPGTGLRMGGSGGPGAYVDGIVIQGFRTYQFDFEGHGVTEVGQIWADNPISSCGLSQSSTGVLIGPHAGIHAHQIYISAQWAGMILLGNGAESTTDFLTIDSAIVGLELGDASYSGNINPSNAYFNNIQGPAIYVGHANAGYHSQRTVISNTMTGSNRLPPYIQSAPGIVTSIGLGSTGQFSVESLQTDLPKGINPFQSGAFIAGPGSTDTLSGITFP
jgi:hypothetical protein